MPRWAQPLASQALERLWREGMVGNAWVAGPTTVVHGHGCHVSEPGGGALEDSVSAVYRRDSGLRLAYLAGGVPPVWTQTPDLAALPEEVRRGVVLFEAGLYFACHEYFETLWGRTGDAASDLYQGIIQIAVAMRHLESHNVRGAVILLRYGMGRLQRYPAVYQGLPLAAWLERLETLLQYLETLPTPRPINLIRGTCHTYSTEK